MRHKMRGRKLGRNASHRKAMFCNMASSLIRTVRVDDDAFNPPATPGRITTTLPKAKELRPFVEKLVTLAKRAQPHLESARQHETDAARNSDAWRAWRESDQWNQWNQAIAPALAYRRRAFNLLRDKEAVDILFDELAERFSDRDGGYTRVVELATPRLGDAGRQAIIEFVGENDRVTARRTAPVVVGEAEDEGAEEQATGEEETAPDATAEGTEAEAAAAEEESSESADETEK